jgi:hypothetical protein
VAGPFHARREAARAADSGLAGCAAGEEAVRVENPNCHPLIRRRRGLFGPNAAGAGQMGQLPLGRAVGSAVQAAVTWAALQ